MAYAFDTGAVVLGMGIGAAALGAWIGVSNANTGNEPEPGWEWMPGTIIEPHFQGTEVAIRLRHLLQTQPHCLGLGIPEGLALALGPEGQVETVGDGEVTVVISQNVIGQNAAV
jgi:cyanophycinase